VLLAALLVITLIELLVIALVELHSYRYFRAVAESNLQDAALYAFYHPDRWQFHTFEMLLLYSDEPVDGIVRIINKERVRLSWRYYVIPGVAYFVATSEIELWRSQAISDLSLAFVPNVGIQEREPSNYYVAVSTLFLTLELMKDDTGLLTDEIVGASDGEQPANGQPTATESE